MASVEEVPLAQELTQDVVTVRREFKLSCVARKSSGSAFVYSKTTPSSGANSCSFLDSVKLFMIV